MKYYAVSNGQKNGLYGIFLDEGYTSVEAAKEAAKKYANGNLINLCIVECNQFGPEVTDIDYNLVANGWHDAGNMRPGKILW